VREYKFRAYDTYTKTMLPIVDIIKFTKSEDIYITRNGTYGVGVNIQYQPRIKLMQYTGLHDKNGVEIYEGDIVRLKFQKNSLDVFAKVEYSTTYAQYIVTGTKTILYENEPLSDYEEIEVIGSIYDNPKLLEGGNKKW